MTTPKSIIIDGVEYQPITPKQFSSLKFPFNKVTRKSCAVIYFNLDPSNTAPNAVRVSFETARGQVFHKDDLREFAYILQTIADSLA